MDASNFLTLFLICSALSSTIVITTALSPDEQEFLDVHNKLRCQVQSPALTWDAALAEKACTVAAGRQGPECKNIPPTMPPEQNMFHDDKPECGKAVRRFGHSLDWEASVYDPCTQSCPETIPCDRFARLASPATLRLGCSSVTCDSGGITLVCLYDPPSNVTTRYEITNQLC